jgi:hypothetical protein
VLQPVIHIGVALQLPVNFRLVIEVKSQRRMYLRLPQVGKTLQNLVHAHTQLVVAGNRADGYARPLDDRRAPGNPWIAREMAVSCLARSHGKQLEGLTGDRKGRSQGDPLD